MSDFSNELGKTLDYYLRLFPTKNLCTISLVESYSVPFDLAKEILFALYQRNFIRNVDCKTYQKLEEIQLEDFLESLSRELISSN